VAVRIVIVGPGRVGTCFGRRFVQAGHDLLGFVGRDPERTRRALRVCGAGRVCTFADLARAHVVVFAVGDGDLAAAIAAAIAAGGARRCSLWLHTSGRHDLDLFAPAVAQGVRCGSLHPVAPFADVAGGLAAMDGAPALVAAGPRAERLLLQLARGLGMVPLPGSVGDRTLYHAGCVLAANGLTVLHDLVERTLAAAGLPPAGRRAVGRALLRAALRGSDARGAANALSGPVRRGDAATVRSHQDALAAAVPEVLPVYRALMAAALPLAAQNGLAAERVAALRQALGIDPAAGSPPPALG
jgi:predicted short-subunit dehydrogenase-like oxidoreductase (DUF2520 family)